MTIVGTRPELIKMSRVIPALDAAFDHVLVHTGQNFDFELNQVFFDELGVRRPDHFLEAAAETPMETIAQVLVRADKVLETARPEAVLVYGDTNSCLAVIAAKRRQIPIFHMEAGNRCFDARTPEEVNRRIVDHTADVNLVLTEQARRYLLAEGLPPDRVFKTGSHMQEVLEHARPGIEASDALERLGLEADRYILVSAHREENVDRPDKLKGLLDALEALAAEHAMPVIVSTHPRTRQRLEALGGGDPVGVRFLPPFGFFDYVRLQTGAFCVVSDSGTIAEEAALLNLPAVTLRESHERPEGQDAGAVVVAARMTPDAVAEAVRIVRATHDPNRTGFGRVADYEGGQVSVKVVRIVAGYIDVVNRVVWSKPSA